MNRLADETSPYLRQHADNPVDWWPWGPEAFAEARRRDVPVLLSVGYSACHWCHVMAHESFEDDATAAQMNDRFVCVKVDREERPDVDAVYMEAVQALTGAGGWPMTVFIDHDGRPFFGGTYYPPQRRGGTPSFTELLTAIDEAWRTQRSEVGEQAERLTEAITATAERLRAGDDGPGSEMLDAALDRLRAAADPEWGGFGRAPKFPQTLALDLLLTHHRHTGDPESLEIAERALGAMAAGGIHDHLGGGFARYSVDRRWLVPHFEKMLYDQALIGRVYLHAWLLTGRADHRRVLDALVGYVLRDLRHPMGGFMSAEDADSEGEEGRFYVWEAAEIEAALGADAATVAAWFGVTANGNFEGRNILHRPGRGALDADETIERARLTLFAARERRVRPGLDDKVLTEWNALMLSTLAEAAAATGRADWLAAAVANGEFLVTHLRREDGRWLRSWQAGDGDRPAQARHLAYAADYATLVDAFTRLAEATGQARWIEEARSTAEELIRLFWDVERGGCFTTGRDAEALVTRPKDLMDTATPSANSQTALAFLRLGALIGDERLVAHAEALLGLIAPLAVEHPTAFGHLLGALDLHLRGPVEVAVVGDRPDLVAEVRRGLHPQVVLAWGEPYDSPLWADRRDGYAYVCRRFACQTPVDTPAGLVDQLARAASAR